jgi:hypothetical protein
MTVASILVARHAKRNRLAPVPIRQFAATLCCQTLARNYAPAVAANGLHGACYREDRFDTQRLAGGVERRIVRSRLDIASG